jgi:hypothetical protein
VVSPVPGIGRRAAARLARAELSKPTYHQHTSLTVRILRAVAGWLGRLFQSASSLPGGWWSLIAVAALAVIAAAAVLGWAGPVLRTRRRRGELTAGGPRRSAAGHREAARQLAEAGDYAAAVCETVRAIAADLDERGVLPPRPGRTADEFAAEAGRAIPAHATALRDAALLFDEIRYGQRSGTAAGYAQVRDLDASVRASARRAAAAAVTAPVGVPGAGAGR